MWSLFETVEYTPLEFIYLGFVAALIFFKQFSAKQGVAGSGHVINLGLY
jgi:hypothetical protein